MFEHWMSGAQLTATQIGLTPEVAMRAHAIVCSVVGAEWIDEQERRSRMPTRTIADVHPLYTAMIGRTELCVVEVCELAALLLHFKSEPALSSLFPALRDVGKYAATVMELDLAWKFAGAGQVILCPPTTHGEADFAVVIEKREYIVEVSGFPSDPFRSELMAFYGAVQTAFKSAERRRQLRGHVALEVIVNPIETQSLDLRRLRPQVHAAVVSAICSFADLEIDPVDQVCDFGIVRVRVAQAHERPDLDAWSIASCLTEVPRSVVDHIGAIDYKNGRDTHWIYLRVPAEVFDPYDRIERKLKIEARQLRGCTDGVIIVAVNGLRIGNLEADDPALRVVIENFRRNHRSTTALALPVRPRKVDGTSGLAGPFFRLADTAMANTIWERVLKVDAQRSVLSELHALA